MRLRAMAKINLGLDVVGKREDGYHEVRMIMQTIHMYDQIDIAKSEEPGIRIKTNLPYLPCNENNLVHKAAKLLMDEFHITKGLDIRLRKFIPVAAGMAGGEFRRGRSHGGSEPDVSSGSVHGRACKTRCCDWCRCALLYYAGDSACGGNRGDIDPIAADAAFVISWWVNRESMFQQRMFIKACVSMRLRTTRTLTDYGCHQPGFFGGRDGTHGKCSGRCDNQGIIP